jgi:DNA-binding beta-propeller fold protein YncE
VVRGEEVVARQRASWIVVLALATLAAGGWLAWRATQPASDAPERMVAAGQQPAAVAIDSRAGRVLVVDYGAGMLRTFDLSGAPLRTNPINSSTGPLAVDEGTGRAFVAADGDTALRIFNTRSGDLLRTITLNLAQHPAMAPDATLHRLFVSSDSGVAIVDTRSGRLLRTFTLSSSFDTIVALAVDKRSGRLLALDHNAGTAIMLDARSGRVLRTIPTGNGPSTLALDSRTARAFVVNANGFNLTVIDTRRGRVVRTLSLDPGPLAVDERRGHVFLATTDSAACGSIYVLDALSGRILHKACVPGIGGLFTAAAVDEPSGRLLVTSEEGVSIFDARGTLLRPTWPDVGPIVAMAIDGRSGRAYLAGQKSFTAYAHDIGASRTWPQQLKQQFPWLPYPAAATPIPAGSGVLGILQTRATG